MSQVQWFLQLDRIPAGSKNPTRPGWIPVEQVMTEGKSAKLGPDRLHFLVDGDDHSSQFLWAYAHNGTHIKAGQLAVEGSGSFRTVLIIEDAFVSDAKDASVANQRLFRITLNLIKYRWFAVS